jgi:periplasmic protein TonB
MGQRMNREKILAFLVATGLHLGVVYAIGHEIAQTTLTVHPITPPVPQPVLAHWIPPSPPVTSPPDAIRTVPSGAIRSAPTKLRIQQPREQTLKPLDAAPVPSVMSSSESEMPGPPPLAASNVLTPAVSSSPAMTSPPAKATPAPSPFSPPRLDASQSGNPPPVYPIASKRLGEYGRVILRIHVLDDGTVGEAQVHTSSGFERLDESAMRAVKRWRFRPAQQGATPIAWWYQQPITFSLETSHAN